METEPSIGEFNFLEENVRKLGAVEAKVVPASVIVVVNRVAEKCRIIRKVFSTTMMQVGSENME